jgi:hypothetical protein
MQDRRIIGFVGLIGAGKDTAADAMPDSARLAFADPIKDVAATIFGWDRELLNGRTEAARAWRETIDHSLSEELGIPDFTPRKALQLLGVEVGRTLSSRIWIVALRRRLSALSSSPDPIIVIDARFKDEIEAIREMGGTVIHVQRDAEKEQEIAERVKSGAEHNYHRSEYDWMETPTDVTVPNTATIEDLHGAIRAVLRDLEASGESR